MDTATDTIPVIDIQVDQPIDPQLTDIVNSPIMLPLETQEFTLSISTSTKPIDIILNDYFLVLSPSYLLLMISFGITGVILYTLYNYLDE